MSLALGACASPRPTSAPPPPWLYEPLSWEKLDRVELWKALDGPRAPIAQVTEAELVLAEGRLEFAERDGGLRAGPAVAGRVDRSREGFLAVLAGGDATYEQRDRAQRGLDRIASLGGAPLAAAPSRGLLTEVVPRATWGARAEQRSNIVGTTGGYYRITVHHSAMPVPAPGASLAESIDAVRLVQRAHMDNNGWADIGYHFLIDPSGRVFEGRDLRWKGAHAGDATKNEGNIGVCLLGTFDGRLPSAAALRALAELLDGLRAENRIASNQVFGHRDFKVTDCPGDALFAWVGRYRAGSIVASSR